MTDNESTPAEVGGGDVEALIRKAWHESGFYARADLDPDWLDGLARITADALAADDAGGEGVNAFARALLKLLGENGRDIGPNPYAREEASRG